MVGDWANPFDNPIIELPTNISATDFARYNMNQANKYGTLTNSMARLRPNRLVKMPDSKQPIDWNMNIILPMLEW